MAFVRANKTAAGAGLVALAALQFERSIDANLARLHAPAKESASIASLARASGAAHVLDIWSRGAKQLRAFTPLSGPTLVALHVIADIAFLAAALVAIVAIVDVPVGVVGASKVARAKERLGGLGGRVWGAALLVAVALSVVVDVLLLWFAHAAVGHAWAAVGTAVSSVQRLTLFLGLFVLVVQSWVRIRRAVGYVFWSPAALRVLLVFDVLFVVVLYGGRIGVQSEDLVERWTEGGAGKAFAALAMYALFVLVVASSRPTDKVAQTETHKRIFVAGVVALVIGGVIYLSNWAGRGAGLLVLGPILAVLALIEHFLPTTGAAPASPDRPGHRLRAVVTAAPAVATGLLLVRTAANHYAASDGWRATGLLAMGVVALALGAGAGALVGSTVPWPGEAFITTHPTAVAFGVAVVAIAVVVIVESYARAFGAFAALFAMLAGLGAIAFAIRAWCAQSTVPRLASYVGLRRAPTLTILVVWLVIASVVDGASNPRESGPRITYEDVRAMTRGNDTAPLPESYDCVNVMQGLPGEAAVKEALCSWVDAAAAARPDAKTLPLVMVTASGGGARAAAWTETVLDCLFFRDDTKSCTGTPAPAKDRWPLMFAANGASGGSVGIASTVAERLANVGPIPDGRGGPIWYRQQLERDPLSQVVGGAILHDTLLGSLGIFRGRDRSAVLEDEWSDPWKGEPARYCGGPDAKKDITALGFVTLATSCRQPLPRMLFNSTDVGTGRRVNVAAVDYNATNQRPGAPFDFVQYLNACQDVSIFTAAFLSARFPLVSSTGRLPTSHGPQTDDAVCPAPARNDNEAHRVLNLVDGGYAENSGSAQVGELWAQLSPLVTAYNAKVEPRIRPVLVQIENGELSTEKPPGIATGSTVGEFFRPVQAIANVVTGGRTSPLSALVADFAPCATKRVLPPGPVLVHFAMYEHPGELLPLGWTLSKHSLDDVTHEYGLELNQDAAACFARATG